MGNHKEAHRQLVECLNVRFLSITIDLWENREKRLDLIISDSRPPSSFILLRRVDGYHLADYSPPSEQFVDWTVDFEKEKVGLTLPGLYRGLRIWCTNNQPQRRAQAGYRSVQVARAHRHDLSPTEPGTFIEWISISLSEKKWRI